LEDYADRSVQLRGEDTSAIPAGSLRCDRFVKSSLASSIAGFIKGGRSGLLANARASEVVSMVLVWPPRLNVSIGNAEGTNRTAVRTEETHLAIFQIEHQLKLVPLAGLGDEL
jgi:hypothetical protein